MRSSKNRERNVEKNVGCWLLNHFLSPSGNLFGLNQREVNKNWLLRAVRANFRKQLCHDRNVRISMKFLFPGHLTWARRWPICIWIKMKHTRESKTDFLTFVSPWKHFRIILANFGNVGNFIRVKVLIKQAIIL